MILVDTNVILDLVENDPVWADWSQQQLEVASLQATLCINSVTYAELSIAFDDIEDLENVLKQGEFRMESIPREALYLAGKAFVKYRKQKGAKTAVLPDFFIGAHAAVAEMPLLTRDTRRYASYFPTVQLIAPQRTKLFDRKLENVCSPTLSSENKTSRGTAGQPWERVDGQWVIARTDAMIKTSPVDIYAILEPQVFTSVALKP